MKSVSEAVRLGFAVLQFRYRKVLPGQIDDKSNLFLGQAY